MPLTSGKTRVHSGLHIVRKPRKGLDRWYVYAWRGGPCIHIAEGAKPVITPAILAKVAEIRRGLPSGGTFDAVIDDYRASPEFDRLRDSTKRDYRRWLDRASAKFGAAPLAAFTDPRMRGEIIAWRDRWAAQPRTADKASVMMATLLGWAVERGRLGVNVAARIALLHRVDKSDQVWERRHLRAMAQCPPQLRDALKLAALTGLRLGDLVRLDWSHVGPNAIILTTAKRKGRAVIPMIPSLKRHIERRAHRTGAILRNSRGKPWTESGLGTVFQRSKPAGFDRTIHDLRGTYATWLATKGFTDEQIAMVLGWTAKRVAEIRARYVNEARVVVAMMEKMRA